jgi:DNA-binding CsgD family transcriptional regulator
LFGSEIVCYNDFPAGGGDVFVCPNVEFDPGWKRTPIFLRYFPEHPLAPEFLQRKRLSPTRVTDVMPFNLIRKTNLYNEYYKQVSADFQMVAGFPGRDGHIIGMSLNQKSRDFTDEELFLFSLATAHMEQAYRTCLAMDAARLRATRTATLLDRQGLGTIAFDDDYRVMGISALAEELAGKLYRCRPLEGALLGGRLLDCVLQLKAASLLELPAVRRPLIHRLEDGATVVVRLELDPERLCHHLILERQRAALSEEELKERGLSSREAEVLRWILQGKTNGETGEILGLAVRTVEKHVERSLKKLG